MIYDLLEIYRANSSGDDLVLANYQLKEGLYFKLYYGERVSDILYIQKKENYSSELYDFFKMADFYSQLVEMNKPIDSRKQIHSNNLYSVTFKAILLKDEIKWRESIERYFAILAEDKNQSLLGDSFEMINQLQIQKNRNRILNDFSFIKAKVKENEIKDAIYVKLFFDVAREDYIREGRRYLLPKIFNDNSYNITADQSLYGLSNSNMGMNAKKPFLEHKTTNFHVPFRIALEEALDTRNVFTWLNGQTYDERPMTSGYLPICQSSIFQMEPEMSRRSNAHFLHMEKGQETVIDDYDFLPGVVPEITPPLDLENFLLLEGFDVRRLNKLSELEAVVDKLLFNNNLVRNYHNEKVKASKYLSDIQVNLLIQYKAAMHNYFRKGDSRAFKSCIDRLTKAMIKASLRKETFKRLNYTVSARAMNLRLSILKYFDNKEMVAVGDQIRQIAEELETKLIRPKNDKKPIANIYCSNDAEFYFYAGQVVSFLLSKSQAYIPTYQLFDPIIEAKNASKFKQEILKLQTKYSHAISIKSMRYNRLCAAIMGYEAEADTLKFDMFLAGLMTQNIIYKKLDDDNEEEISDEEK